MKLIASKTCDKPSTHGTPMDRVPAKREVVDDWPVRHVDFAEYWLNADRLSLCRRSDDESTRSAVTETTEPLFTQKEEHHDRE
jgi:hypothetical protein